MRKIVLIFALLFLGGCAWGPASMEKRTAYVRSVDRPVRVEEAVLTQSLAMGMTPKEVEMTFGQPTYVSASAYKGYGRTLQWCYKNYLSGQLRCLYFRSNELVGWN